MTVCKKHFCKSALYSQSGASVLEVLLAIAVVLAISPFMYNQIIDMTHDVQDIAMANKIVSVRDGVINFVRVNQNQWEDVAEIKMDEKDIEKIAPMAHSGFVDKYMVNGATITDVYLAFDVQDKDYREANVARYIGVVEAEKLVPVGEIKPECVHASGIYVDAIYVEK